MQAKELRAADLLTLNKVQFVIPIYQRDYEWTQTQCEQLLKDIVIAGSAKSSNPHFIGSVVYVHDDIYTSSKIKELSIIDGQQRLTSLNLIYLAIYRHAIEVEDRALADEIYETYLVNKFTADGAKLKLQQTPKNQLALDHLLSLADTADFTGFSRIITNFNYFAARINKDNCLTIQDGLQKLMIVEVSLDRDKDNPQRIFESLNSTGLELTQADLIRNYILMGLNRQQQNRLYKTYWSVIEKNAGFESDSTSKVSDFIRDYLTLVNRVIPNKNKVYLSFKTNVPTNNIEDLEPILMALKSLSRFYNKIINPVNEPDLDIRRELDYIASLEISVMNPFLMKVYEDYANTIISKCEFLDILTLLQTYAFRRVVAGLATNTMNKVFMNLYDKIDKSDYVSSLGSQLARLVATQRMPSDSEIIEALAHKDFYNTRPKTKMYLLSKLENFNNKEFVKIIGNSDITIEHIFPQNPHEEWGDDLSDEEMSVITTKYLHTIANLTLSGNNGSLGNRSFVFKRDLPEKGYRYSRLWLNKSLSEIGRWDINEITTRLSILTDRIMGIWPYPDVSVSADVTNEDFTMVNLFDADDPYYKKLAAATFFDEPLGVTTIASLFSEAIAKLFELNPNLFFSSDIASILNVADIKTQHTLRQPRPISDTYFIEGNLDSRSKLSKLKQVLSIFDMEDAVYIRYDNTPAA